MTTTPKLARATIVKHDSVKGIQSLLQALPDKAKDDLSLKEAVIVLQEPLQAALAKGYTYPDLATLLTDTGIPISPATLKNYVPTGKRSGKGRAKPTKVRRRAVTPVAPEAQLASPVTAEAIATPPIAPAPPTETSTKRRGKTTRSATAPTDTSIAPAALPKRRGKAKATTTETAATDTAIAPAAGAITPTKQRGQTSGRKPKAATATAPTETTAKPTARAGKSAKASTQKKSAATRAAKQTTPARTKSGKTRKPGKSDT